MASASPTLALVATSSLLLAAAVSGCGTTQDANKRIDVRFDRTLASRKPLELKGTDPHVQVVRTSVVGGQGGSAIVVVLRNRGDASVNDLPIEVGPRGGRALNTGANVPYFQSHAPAIGPGDEVTWVYVSKDSVSSGAAFARVGAPAPAAPRADRVPAIQVSDSGAPAGEHGDSVQAELTNDTGVPQYDLDVYAVARRGGRYVAAGRASLEHLGTGQSARVTLNLIGEAKGSEITVFAPPTLFE